MLSRLLFCWLTLALVLPAQTRTWFLAQARGPRGGRVSGPDPIDRLNRMSPQDRRRMMDRLPPERRALVQEKLDRLEKLSPDEREHLRRQYEDFRNLPPSQQATVRQAFRRFNSLGTGRRKVLREEYENLKLLDPEERQTRMNSEDFRKAYAPEERGILMDLSDGLVSEDTPDKRERNR